MRYVNKTDLAVHVVIVVPINTYLDKMHHVAQEKRSTRDKRIQIFTVLWCLKLRYRDRNNDSDKPVAEDLHASFFIWIKVRSAN